MKKVEESSPFDEVNMLLEPHERLAAAPFPQSQPKPTPDPKPSKQYPLVKIYNLQGDLLYITASVQLQGLMKHDWFNQQLIINIYWYDSAGKAMDAKATMLDREQPKWNKRRF